MIRRFVEDAPLFARGIRDGDVFQWNTSPLFLYQEMEGAVRGQPPRTAPKECPVYYTAGNVEPCLTGPSAAPQP